MTNDRRRESRYALSLPVDIGNVRAYTRTVGVRGALIVSPRPFEAGDVVPLVMTITFTEQVTPTALVCTASVRRIRKLREQWMVAVEFDELRVRVETNTRERASAAPAASL